MTIKCPNCGQVLPKDNAKFCNSCGVDLRRLPTEPPSWMRSLDRGERTGKSPQQDESTQRVPYSRNRELHARAWESKKPDYLSRGQEFPTFSEEDTISPDESPVFEDSVEDLPTSHLEATIPESRMQKSTGTQRTREFNDAPQGSALPQMPTSPAVWNALQNDVAQLSTNQLASQGQVKSGDPLKQQEAARFRPRPMQPEGVIFQKPPSTPQLGARESQDPSQAGAINRTPRPLPPFQSVADTSAVGAKDLNALRSASLGPLQEGGRAVLGPQSQAPMSMVTKPVGRQGMSLKRLALVLALLVTLVVGGVAAWFVAAKPFAVASITEPWQKFCDSGLGVSGQYPTGWTKQVDASKGLHFSDGTDQVGITAVATNGQDAGTYLRKEASHLGITGLKLGAPVSFAGTSWQQAQGSLIQTGVTYTETLLVTTHGSQFFTIMQIAPPGTYNEEDATIFSGMRSSFQFSNSCP